MKQLSLQSEYVLQQKDSDIQKETEKYSLSKTKQKIKHKKIVTKVKLLAKRKKYINSSSQTTNISSTETSVKEENEKNIRPRMSKELKVVKKKKKYPIQMIIGLNWERVNEFCKKSFRNFWCLSTELFVEKKFITFYQDLILRGQLSLFSPVVLVLMTQFWEYWNTITLPKEFMTFLLIIWDP